jgi:hypothetical protein
MAPCASLWLATTPGKWPQAPCVSLGLARRQANGPKLTQLGAEPHGAEQPASCSTSPYRLGQSGESDMMVNRPHNGERQPMGLA